MTLAKMDCTKEVQNNQYRNRYIRYIFRQELVGNLVFEDILL
jgi:hypothetical protein